jgi:hypothetical protein
MAGPPFPVWSRIMADKFLGVAIGGKLATDVVVGDSTGSQTVELRVTLGTSNPALTRQALLDAVGAIEQYIVKTTFPVT